MLRPTCQNYKPSNCNLLKIHGSDPSIFIRKAFKLATSCILYLLNRKNLKNIPLTIRFTQRCFLLGMYVCSNCCLFNCSYTFFILLQIFEGANHVNVSHTIHDLSFGPKYPGIQNPLDGTSRILRGASGTFKYYIKVNIVCYIV